MGKPLRVTVACLAVSGVGVVSGLQSASVKAAAPPPQGSSTASAIQLSINPAALLTLPTALTQGIGAIPGLAPLVAKLNLQNLTGLTQVGVGLTDAYGVEPAARGDLSNGHSDATLLQISNAAINPLLQNLGAVLTTLVQQYLAPSIDQTVAALPSQFTGSNTAITQAATALTQLLDTATLPVTAGLQDALRGVSADVNAQNSLGAINLVGVTTQQSTSTATAANRAFATSKNLANPEAQGVHALNALGIAQPITVGNALPSLQALETAITGQQGILQAVSNAANQSTITCATLAAAVAQLPSPLGTTLGTSVSAACGVLPTVGGATALALATLIDTAINPLITQFNTALNTLQTSLISALPTLLQGIGVGSLLNVTPLTTVSTVESRNSGAHGNASVSIATIQAGNLLSALPGVPVPNILEVDNLASSADAFTDGVDTTAPTAGLQIGAVKLLGQSLPVPAQGTSQTIPVAVPGLGTLSVTISVGQPQVINNSVARKTIKTSLLDVVVRNGDAGGANPVLALGGTGGEILELNVAGAFTDVSAGQVVPPPQGCTGPQCQPPTSTPTTVSNPAALPPTGMFGPGALAAAIVLGGAGLGLQLTGRRRRRGRSDSAA